MEGRASEQRDAINLDRLSVRAIDFRQSEKLPEAALRALVVEAADLNTRSPRKR